MFFVLKYIYFTYTILRDEFNEESFSFFSTKHQLRKTKKNKFEEKKNEKNLVPIMEPFSASSFCLFVAFSPFNREEKKRKEKEDLVEGESEVWILLMGKNFYHFRNNISAINSNANLTSCWFTVYVTAVELYYAIKSMLHAILNGYNWFSPLLSCRSIFNPHSLVSDFHHHHSRMQNFTAAAVQFFSTTKHNQCKLFAW